MVLAEEGSHLGSVGEAMVEMTRRLLMILTGMGGHRRSHDQLVLELEVEDRLVVGRDSSNSKDGDLVLGRPDWQVQGWDMLLVGARIEHGHSHKRDRIRGREDSLAMEVVLLHHRQHHQPSRVVDIHLLGSEVLQDGDWT